MQNLFDISKAEFGYYYNYKNGAKVIDSKTGTSNFIEVKQNVTYSTSENCNITYWDENKNYISGLIAYRKFTVPNDARIRYIRMSIWGNKNQMDKWQLLEEENNNQEKPIEPIDPSEQVKPIEPIEPITPNEAKSYYNVKDYGVIGDGKTDDTKAIQNIINTVGENGGGIIYFPNGKYRFSDMIRITYSHITLKGETNSVLEYHGRGQNINFISIYGVWKNKKYLENVVLDNIVLDCTYQEFKGGATEDDLKATSPKPLNGSQNGIYMQYCYNSKIINCKLKDIYGNGIYINRSSFCTVDNCFLEDCSASRMGDTKLDYTGDGINANMSFAITFSNNKVINRRTFKVHNKVGEMSLQFDVYGLQCARSGLQFEYPVDMDYKNNPEKWCPYADLVSNMKDGYHLIMKNNYVYGYNKGVHLEYSVNALIDGNSFIHCNMGILDATGGATQIINNEFNSDNVGKSPQGGYDWYYGSVVFTHFLGTTYDNAVVMGNRFYGDAQGICYGRSNIHIINNDFRNTDLYIKQRGSGHENIVIDGNKFIAKDKLDNNNNYKIRFELALIYNSKFINNSFISDNYHIFILACLKNCLVSNNTFINTRFDLIDISDNNIFTNNLCNEKLIETNNTKFNVFPAKNSIISNNVFKGEKSKVISGHSNNSCIKNNNINITENTTNIE